MIKIKIEENMMKCSIKLKELKNDVFVYQNEFNECFALTHPKNKSTISSILTILETEPVLDKEHLQEIYNHYRRVNKKFFGNPDIIQQ